MNPYRASGHWNVDPDNRQYRGSGIITERQVTSEEAKMYGIDLTKISKTNTEVRLTGKNVNKIRKTAIDKERLIELLKEHGVNSNTYEIAAKEFRVSMHSISNYVSSHKLRKLIESIA